MINEAYVSLEVAKLLKDKGFNEATNRYYNAQYNECRTVSDTFMWHWNDECHMKHVMMEGAIAIPTHQMVMAWLREVHHIAINIGWGEVFEEQYKWWCIILNMDNGNILCDTNCHASYEEAVEAAIKYSLENLI